MKFFKVGRDEKTCVIWIMLYYFAPVIRYSTLHAGSNVLICRMDACRCVHLLDCRCRKGLKYVVRLSDFDSTKLWTPRQPNQIPRVEYTLKSLGEIFVGTYGYHAPEASLHSHSKLSTCI